MGRLWSDLGPIKMILLLNNNQIISSLSDLWGCFTMCMDCKSDSSLEQYSDHHQIIRTSAPWQNCGDLEGLLSGTWRLLGCCTIHMIQVPSSDLWRLFGALHKYIIQCFITDSWWLKVTVDCTLRYKAPRSDFWSDRHLWKCLLLNDHLLISSHRLQNWEKLGIISWNP